MQQPARPAKAKRAHDDFVTASTRRPHHACIGWQKRSITLNFPDDLILAFDRGLRTVAGPAVAARTTPAQGLAPAEMSDTERLTSGRMMRVNHTGEVCAQALYQGQALLARSPATRQALLQAAHEEWDHLGWCAERLQQLQARPSLGNPLWYAGSFLLGAASAAAGDRWNMAFLVETERQVERHLDGHLEQISPADLPSRAIMRTMRAEEGEHADMAIAQGAATLPKPLQTLMRATARVMTATAYWI